MADAASRDEIELLKAEIAALKAARTGAMKETQCCPGCGHRTILHFTQVTEQSNAALRNMALAHTSTWRGIGNLAELEAFACRACGRVEWYAKGLDEIEPDGDLVRLLTASPNAKDAGPYR